MLRRETEFTDVSLRLGGTGTLIFATQTRRIFTPRSLAIVEQSHTVFREEVKAGEKSVTPKRNKPPADTPWLRSIMTDPVSLFRYSALTFNPHRIHYDRDYAMRIEGYPGLVVHGPYSQQCLIDLARDHAPGQRLNRLRSEPVHHYSIRRLSALLAALLMAKRERSCGPSHRRGLSPWKSQYDTGENDVNAKMVGG